MNTDLAIKQTADRLMRAVVESGVIRSFEQDGDLAVRIMREELKALLFADKYADERAIALTGGSGLAWASLLATCLHRIANERSA